MFIGSTSMTCLSLKKKKKKVAGLWNSNTPSTVTSATRRALFITHSRKIHSEGRHCGKVFQCMRGEALWHVHVDGVNVCTVVCVCAWNNVLLHTYSFWTLSHRKEWIVWCSKFWNTQSCRVTDDLHIVPLLYHILVLIHQHFINIAFPLSFFFFLPKFTPLNICINIYLFCGDDGVTHSCTSKKKTPQPPNPSHSVPLSKQVIKIDI